MLFRSEEAIAGADARPVSPLVSMLGLPSRAEDVRGKSIPLEVSAFPDQLCLTLPQAEESGRQRSVAANPLFSPSFPKIDSESRLSVPSWVLGCVVSPLDLFLVCTGRVP